MQPKGSKTGSLAAFHHPFYHKFVVRLDVGVNLINAHLKTLVLGYAYLRFKKLAIFFHTVHKKRGEPLGLPCDFLTFDIITNLFQPELYLFDSLLELVNIFLGQFLERFGICNLETLPHGSLGEFVIS